MISYLIRSGRQWIGNESGDLIHEAIRLPGMKNPGKAPHLRPGLLLEPLEPVVHDPALPSVVHRIRRRHRRMEQPHLLVRRRPVDRHLDDRVELDPAGGVVAAGAGEVGAEGGVGGDDGIVGDQGHGEGDQEQVEDALATHLFLLPPPLSLCFVLGPSKANRLTGDGKMATLRLPGTPPLMERMKEKSSL